MSDLIKRLAYSVANAKQGEGPTMRCEPPSDYDVDIARQWVRRVLDALANPYCDCAEGPNGETPKRCEGCHIHTIIENAKLREEIAYLKGQGHVGGGMICDFSPDFQKFIASQSGGAK